jgi:hypothetical protein
MNPAIMSNLLRSANVIFFISFFIVSHAQTNYGDYLTYENIFSDDFSNNNVGWPTGLSANGCYSSKIENGAFEITSTCKETYPSYWIPRSIDVTRDFEIEAGLLYVRGESTNSISLIWGKDDKYNSFHFGISGNGQFKISQYNGSWIILKDWTVSDLVHMTDYNKLTVRKIGTKYYFFLNEKLVLTYDFYPFSGNQVGFQDNQNTTMRIKYLKLSYIKPVSGVAKTKTESTKSFSYGKTEGGYFGISTDYILLTGNFDGKGFFSPDNNETILVPKLSPNIGFGAQIGMMYENLGFDWAYYYSRMDYTSQTDGFSGIGTTHLIRWLGVKCYFNGSNEKRIKPYIDIDLSIAISHFDKLTYLSNNTSDFRSANYTGFIIGAGIGTLIKLNKNLALDLKVLPEYYSGTKIKSKGEPDHSIKKFNNFLLINSFGINYYFNKK